MAVTKVDKETMVEGMVVMKAARGIIEEVTADTKVGKETIEEGMVVMKADKGIIKEATAETKEVMAVMELDTSDCKV